MQDSDDYFTDDFVLDDQALAVLDQEEQKFAISLTQAQSVNGPPPPVTKRQKTEQGWKPGVGSRRGDSPDDMEDLPEISVQGDGTYGFRTARHVTAKPGPIPSPTNINQVPSKDNRSMARSLERSQSVSSIQDAVASRARPQPSPRPSGASRTSSFHAGGARPPSQNAYRVPQRQATTSPGHLSRNSSILPVAHTRSQNQLPLSKPASPVISKQGETQVEALRLQMEELHRENQRIQDALKEVVDLRLAKEGEVSILRKGMERTAQDHAAQVAKLKAAKNDADAKRSEVQKEMKDEIERLRTQFTFKQHELETSIRKPPWSARAKKTNNDIPPTPAKISSQIRGWNTSNNDTAGPSKALGETPRRPRFGSIACESPKAARNRKKAPVPAEEKKSAMLPGFYNSFLPSSPNHPGLISPSKGKGKQGAWTRKGKQKELAPFAEVGSSQVFSNSGPPPSPPSSPAQHKQTSLELDVDMGDTTFGPASVGGELIDDIEPLNWREDLHHLILTHTLSLSSSSTAPTFQTLLRAPLPDPMSSSTMETYHSACSRLLEILAAMPKYNEWDVAVRTVSNSFAEIAHVLDTADLVLPLTGLLSLSTLLIYSLPSFSSAFLSTSQGNPGSSPRILTVVCNVVRKRLLPGSTADSDDQTLLALETVGLLEALCWNISDDVEEHLALIPRSEGVLSTLLDPSQPAQLLDRSVRLLVFLVSRPNIFRHLLAYPDSGAANEEQADKDFSKIPHIERLCSYLVDTGRRGTEAESMRTSILTFFSMLAGTHVDALTILLESQTLVPSLVLYLTHLSSPLWEDDEKLMASPPQILSCLRTLDQTLSLLHYLIFNPEQIANLRYKLHQASRRHVNGINHMFIVTFGRLSYADPPDWIPPEGKLELGQMAELARDLLDLVVEGPEGDSVWAAYQEEPEKESVTDDEEMEARLLDANII